MNTTTLKRLNVIVIIASALGSASLLGQAPSTAPAPAKPAQDITELDVIVVTGRAGTDVRTKAQTSYALTDISADQLRMQAPMGVAEALKAIPGFWVEASGGEASNNIRARGIPWTQLIHRSGVLSNDLNTSIGLRLSVVFSAALAACLTAASST